MCNLINSYISLLAKNYKIVKLDLGDSRFSVYSFKENSMKGIYVWLYIDFTSSIDIDCVLNTLSLYDHTSKEGKSYLCIIPAEYTDTELCTHCNGKSFVHFVFYNLKKQVICDKSIYYAGSNKIKCLLDHFVACFSSVTGDDTVC